MIKYTIVYFLFGMLFLCLHGSAYAGDSRLSLEAAAFSQGPEQNGLPTEWEKIRFIGMLRYTQYSFVHDEGVRVVKAVSDNAASGIAHSFIVNVKEYPFITWRWKIKNLIKKNTIDTKDGDDYPARLYVMFSYDPRHYTHTERLLFHFIQKFYQRVIPARALCYVWSTKTPAGTIEPSPYTPWVQTVVVEQGKKNLNKWQFEERHVYEDYKKAFGHEPPAVMGIGIMTDADSTGEEATAYYGDVRFWKQ